MEKTHKSRLIENFFSLSALQAVNYIVPLITIPYLTRVLGPEKYGLIAFAQAFTLYFFLITNYGFNLSATRKVSVSRDDPDELNRIVSITLSVQVMLFLISCIVMGALCLFVTKFRNEALLYSVTFSAVLGNVFFPLFFFQGMEKMRVITVFNAIGKTIFLLLLVVLVRKESDYIIAAGLYSAGLITTSLFLMIALVVAYKVRIAVPSMQDVLSEFREGWHIFISTFTMGFYASTNTVILGFFASDAVVGYYNAGEKIIKALQGLSSPVTQAVYPFMSRLAAESKESAMRFISRITRLGGTVSLLMSLLLLIFAPRISRIILGEQFRESVIVIQILSFYPFFSFLSNIFSTQIMLNFGMQQLFSRIVISASLINIVLSLILVLPLEHRGVSISLLIAEVLMMSVSLFSLYNRGIRVNLIPMRKIAG